MAYINMKKQGLNKTIPISKKSSDLGVTPVKTQGHFCVPTWGFFNNGRISNMIESRGEGEEDWPVYNTLWIGKDIVPDMHFITGTWRDLPPSTTSILKSLAFEDGRTDNLLSTLFGDDTHTIRIAKSIRFPEGTTDSIISKVQLGKLINYKDDITSEDFNLQDDKCSWNVYLPGTLSEINFNVLVNLVGSYAESEGIDRQVHIYLDRHTTVPTISRLTEVTEEPGDTVYARGTNIYFHVSESIYDAFVEAYDGQFRGIVKIKSEADSWMATRPEIVKTGSYDSLIDRPFYSEEVSDETFNLKSMFANQIYGDQITSGELFAIQSGSRYSVNLCGVPYSDDLEGLTGRTVTLPKTTGDTLEVSYIGNLKEAAKYNDFFYLLDWVDSSEADSLEDSDLPFCVFTDDEGDTCIWAECNYEDNQTIVVTQSVPEGVPPTFTYPLDKNGIGSICLVSKDSEEAIKKFNAAQGNEITLSVDGKRESATWKYSETETKDSTIERFRADFEKSNLSFTITRQEAGGSYYDEQVFFEIAPPNTRNAQVSTFKTSYHTLDDNFLSENIVRKDDLSELIDLPEPVAGIDRKTLLTMDLTRVVSEESGSMNFQWEHNLDSNQFRIVDDGPDFNFNSLVEGSSPVENPLESFYPPEGLITVEYDGNTYMGTPYIVWYEENGGQISEGYLVGPVWDDWSPEDAGLPSDTTVPEDQQSWPFVIEFDTLKNSDGSEIIRGLTSIFTDFFYGFMDDADNIEVGTKSLSIKIESYKVKKLDKELLPDDVVKAASDTENLKAFVNDEITRISNLDHVDFVFLEPQDMSSKVVLGYDDSQSTEYVQG